VQRRPPFHERGSVGLQPEPGDERAKEQLLRARHLPVRWHLERAKLEKTEPAARTVGRIELVDAELRAVRVARHVDEQVAKQPVDEPGSSAFAGFRKLAKGYFELVDGIVARF